MSRLLRLAPLGLALLSLGASTAGACGWEMTCNTEEWLAERIDELLP